jgi:hypothetical protein
MVKFKNELEREYYLYHRYFAPFFKGEGPVGFNSLVFPQNEENSITGIRRLQDLFYRWFLQRYADETIVVITTPQCENPSTSTSTQQQQEQQQLIAIEELSKVYKEFIEDICRNEEVLIHGDRVII